MKKLIGTIILSIVIGGCATSNEVQSGKVVRTTTDPATGLSTSIMMSEYFESQNLIADGQVLAHLIVTLGAERLPDGHPLLDLDRYQDNIEQVTEIYFTNKSAEPITISNIFLQRNSGKLEITPLSIAIPAKQWVKSKPIIGATSIYRPNIESVLHYEYNGQPFTANLPEMRRPVKRAARIR